MDTIDNAMIVDIKPLPLCQGCQELFKRGSSAIGNIANNLKAAVVGGAFSRPDDCCLHCYNTFCDVTESSKLIESIKSKLPDHKVTLFIEITSAGMFDITRAIFRQLIASTNTNIKVNSLADLFKTVLTFQLQCLHPTIQLVDTVAKADYRCKIHLNFTHQFQLLQAITRIKSISVKKRKFNVNLEESGNDKEMELTTRTEIDQIISRVKELNKEEMVELMDIMHEYAIYAKNEKLQYQWTVDCHRCPIYLLGRYCKYSRDVPQSPWMIDNERKGRNSVEEIITAAVEEQLGTINSCKFHGCGREDIDVRCLGNGRPFVLEASNTTKEPTAEILNSILSSINSGQLLNSERDLEVKSLIVTTKETWETMQEVAEEKKKAYCCVVWSKQKLSLTDLKRLERLASSDGGLDVDDENNRCLRIEQKTPLRVLHRRSLLTRPRYVYDIETVLLNPHYFIMKLVTSAGAYVKEFVHGDMGRTSPSVSSILNCKTSILQLDVIGLYDEFEGGLEHIRRTTEVIDVTPVSAVTTVREVNNSSRSWDQMKRIYT